jgi:hypothetical protein
MRLIIFWLFFVPLCILIILLATLEAFCKGLYNVSLLINDIFINACDTLEEWSFKLGKYSDEN